MVGSLPGQSWKRCDGRKVRAAEELRNCPPVELSCHVNGAGDENRVDAGVSRAADIRPEAIADRQYALPRHWASAQRAEPVEGHFIDRQMGFSGVSDPAAQTLVLGGQRPGAIDDA